MIHEENGDARPPAGTGSGPGQPQAHPGWSQQIQGSYEAGNSGGWGGPDGADTGPLHLNAESGAEPEGGSYAVEPPGHGPQASQAFPPGPAYGPGYGYPQTSAGGPNYAPGGAAPAGYYAAPQPGPYDPTEAFATPAAPPRPPGGSSPGPGSSRSDSTKTGLAAVFDFSFVARATRTLARPLFWLVVALVVIDIITVLVTMLTARGFGYSGGAVFFAFLQALLTGAVKIALARLFLELCVNVSDLAQQRSERR